MLQEGYYHSSRYERGMDKEGMNEYRRKNVSNEV